MLRGGRGDGDGGSGLRVADDAEGARGDARDGPAGAVDDGGRDGAVAGGERDVDAELAVLLDGRDVGVAGADAHVARRPAGADQAGEVGAHPEILGYDRSDGKFQGYHAARVLTGLRILRVRSLGARNYDL